MQVLNLEQGSEDWKMARIGRVTASKFKDVMAKGRGSSPSKTRLSYMYQLAAEILTGEPQDSYTNDAMAWGTETEPQARQAYEFQENVEVKEVGFVVKNEMIGVSPDGFVCDKGLLEIKCPKTTTQIQRFLTNEFPSEYKAQVQGQIWVCEREWCDFVSFDPRINAESHYFKIRVQRDDVFIKSLEKEINVFIDELQEMLAQLQPKEEVAL